MDSHKIRNAILEHVAVSPTKITPPQLEKTVSHRFGLTKTQIKALIKDLISSAELTYIYEYGSTFLEKSFSKPVRISNSVVLKPPGHHYRQKPDDAVIRIKSGASFGGGRHPTTRLSVKAIEYVLKQVRPKWLNKNCSVLDIGTGSGILAIAAVCLGIKKGLGLDIDPCAIAEARDNIALNHLQGQLVISDREIDAIDQAFSMVIANLRYPSLKNFYPQISKLTDTGGWVVLSGFRPHERDDLMDLYTAKYFKCIWTADEIDWAVTVLKKI
ncbi:MAG: 50S ribosomal protein L11 methyltransferase [Desulfobacterales bacterium]|nr:50S ribosomal protein L11 methyltransferase [Desulfobacterales bacterium]